MFIRKTYTDGEIYSNTSAYRIAKLLAQNLYGVDFDVGVYATENSYYIVIENNLVKYIYINGDPSCLGIEKNDEVNLDEKMLKNLALEKIEIPEGYQVKRQRVKKIYDEKPYYRVITYLENNYGFSVSKIFEYRLE